MNGQSDQTDIVEGEIINDSQEESGVGVEMDWIGMINSQLSQIESLKEQLKKFREMLQSIYDNDPTYQEHDKLVKEATKVRSQTKKQLAKLPQVADLGSRISEVRNLLKERQEDLSDYVQQYAKASGATTLETNDGSVRQIVYTAKLIKK